MCYTNGVRIAIYAARDERAASAVVLRSCSICHIVVEGDELGGNAIAPVQVSSHCKRCDDMPGIDDVFIRVLAIDANAMFILCP